jgi:hypothetical protein
MICEFAGFDCPGQRVWRVVGLEHKPSEPKLDWWGQIRGRMLGNRHLMDQDAIGAVAVAKKLVGA